jgi:hypothetical protein
MGTSTFSLVLLGMLMGTVAGAGLYQLITVMPTWFASPPASFAGIGAKRDRMFWIPLQTLNMLALLFALVMNWGIPGRRSPLLVTLGANVLVWIATGVYFVPEILKFTKMAKDRDARPTPDLSSRGRQWLRLQWGRIALLVLAQVFILFALAANEMRS